MLVVGAAAWVLWTTQVPAQPAPLDVKANDFEIAWLNPATSGTSWQRFVQAVRQIEGLEAGGDTAPEPTTVTPEVFVRLPHGRGRLVFRWYKLTSEWNTRYWTEALLKRDPPPLAIMGGGT